MIDLHQSIKNYTGASAILKTELIQSLWSGYGKLLRVHLEDCPYGGTIIVKHVQPPKLASHARGWNTDLGHQRKLRSYQVETTWYQDYSHLSQARLPSCIAIEQQEDEVLILLEDLDAAGFALRKHRLGEQEIEACIAWLAQFHASYLDHEAIGLWEVGTYWHLATRPEELSVLSDKPLKEAAAAIDDLLNTCKYKTLVHGDAKLANFCFAPDGQVAGVDYQYVGGGCGMKDLVYFIGSCLPEHKCESLEAQILDSYFSHLQESLGEPDQDLETEWRSLYRVAWADFHRFIKGWSPGHWKINSYSERITQSVIKNL